MSTTYRSLTLSILALVALSAVAGPLASAQGNPTFIVETIQDPAAPIQPDIGSATIVVPWKYTLPNPAVQGFGATTSSVTLTWDPPTCDNPNVLVTGALAESISLIQGTESRVEYPGESEFNIAVNQNAPGEQKIKCTFTGRVSAVNQAAPATQPNSGTVNVVGAYLGLITVNVPGTIKQSGPQKQIRYDLEVSNLGNSRSTINFNLQSEDPTAGGWNPVVPTPIVLESTSQGGQLTTQTVSFLVSTPFKNGWNNKDTTFLLQIQPVSTKDVENMGQPVVVNVLARVRGVYVPSLEPMVLVGAILGTALVARLTRED